MTIILEVQICASTWKGKNFLVLTQPLALQETRFAPVLDADIGLSLRNINLVTAYPKSSWKKHNKTVGDARKSSEAKHQQQQNQHKQQQKKQGWRVDWVAKHSSGDTPLESTWNKEAGVMSRLIQLFGFWLIDVFIDWLDNSSIDTVHRTQPGPSTILEQPSSLRTKAVIGQLNFKRPWLSSLHCKPFERRWTDSATDMTYHLTTRFLSGCHRSGWGRSVPRLWRLQQRLRFHRSLRGGRSVLLRKYKEKKT